MNTNTKPKKNISSIASIFAEMVDQRKPKGIRYHFQSLLILLSLSKLCFQDTPSEIADWISNRSDLLKEKLGLEWKKMPSQSTWQRLISQNIEATENRQWRCDICPKRIIKESGRQRGRVSMEIAS